MGCSRFVTLVSGRVAEGLVVLLLEKVKDFFEAEGNISSLWTTVDRA